jgi:hypothetical protein
MLLGCLNYCRDIVEFDYYGVKQVPAIPTILISKKAYILNI